MRTATILANYCVLCVALEEINKETHDVYGVKVGGYLDNFSTYFGLMLSHLVFSGAEQLSLMLQATMAAELAIQYLQKQYSDSSFIPELLMNQRVLLQHHPYLDLDDFLNG